MDYIASISYGKDSLAMLEAIKLLKLPLTRIVTADVMATKTISANNPKLAEFKKYADKEILKRYGIKVEHYKANITFEEGLFYEMKRGKYIGVNRGFPTINVHWCQSRLKLNAIKKCQASNSVQYIGIAADEYKRISQKYTNNTVMPLVQIGWNEADCRAWCKNNNMLSPVYMTQSRDGCWFCPFQSIKQLRSLYHDYPELWNLLLEWDLKSSTCFRSDGTTVHDFDKRFKLEDEGKVPLDRTFRWSMIKEKK